MKKIILTFLIAYSINSAYSQAPSQVISGGTWVVESNISSPREQVIKFYNSRLELIYEESVNNKKVRYEKERIRNVLNKTLQLALSNEEKIKPGTFTMLLSQKSLKIRKQNNESFTGNF